MLFALTNSALVLFAAEPTWTDKEVLEVLLKVLGILATVAAIAIPLATTWTRRRARLLQKERDKLLKDNDKLNDALTLARFRMDSVSGQLQKAETDLQLLESEKEIKCLEMDEHLGNLEKVKSDLSLARQEAEGAKGDLHVERRRVERAKEKDGQTWTEKVRSNLPDFKPLEPEGRRMPIISVLNLKGGVGKTTITANLGAALDQLGYRVLLVDLDLQGSLTSLFLNEDVQVAKHEKKEMVGDFFFASYEQESPNLLDYSQPILASGKSSLVGTSDALAYAESNMLIRWVLRDGTDAKKDPRFLLRRELHLKRISSKYDVVLLDCPPLLSITCVNALAASDYLLVPVMPSKQVTARVPVLLEYFKKIRDNVNSGLNLLGIVANRTFRSTLTSDEMTRVSTLRGQCRDRLRQDVVIFDTIIQDKKEVREAEDNHRPLNPGDATFASFVELAREITARFHLLHRATRADLG